MKLRFDAWDVGWRIGDAHEPRGGELKPVVGFRPG